MGSRKRKESGRVRQPCVKNGLAYTFIVEDRRGKKEEKNAIRGDRENVERSNNAG